MRLTKYFTMKHQYFFFFRYGIFVFVFLVGCRGSDDDPFSGQDKAIFRIRYTQQGDLEGFTRMFNYDTNLASSEDFVWFDSKEQAPAYLDTDSLTESSYVLETKVPVKEITLNLSLGWIPTRAWADGWQGPDEMAIELSVWKNDERIDTQEMRLSSNNKPSLISFQKSYTTKP